jgi:ATP-dependent DNA helicase RecG
MLLVSYEIIDVDNRAAQFVLDTVESYTADLKAIEVAPAKLTKSMSAFCNADGGELFIGVDEDKGGGVRTWRGFDSVEAAYGHIQAFEDFFPLSQDVEYEFLRRVDHPEAGLVLKVTLRRTPDVRRASDGRVYVRRGAQNLPLDADAVLRLEYQKGSRSFETHTVDVPLDLVTSSERIIGFMLEIVPTGEPESWLTKQLLIREGKPTVVSILLFADEPQAALPKQSAVKVYRYATTDAEGARANLVGQPLTVEGGAYQVIREAVRTTVDLVQGIRVMTPNGLEEITYPEVALHEIITNAILHRDYSIADDVHVRIFDNRIEVESPGWLPRNLTPQNILTERFSRNGNLVRWINKFPDPPNKDVGEGLRAAFDAMKELKLQPPEIVDKRSSVLVMIRHQRLASPEEMILEYLQHHAEISNSVVRRLTGIGSENTVKRIFQRMIKGGELESIPGRPLRDAAYRLPGSTAAPTPPSAPGG